MPFLRHKTNKYLKEFKKKGFFKNPIIYFGIFSVIFLIGIILIPQLIAKSPSGWDFSFLIADIHIPASSSSQNLFTEPIKNPFRESSEMIFLQQNTLVRTNPTYTVSSKVLGSVINDTEVDVESRKSIIEYAVESGETLSSIAAKFDISLNTILWANDLNKSSKIRVGQKLIIPPVSGIIYNVKKGDTLSAIAKTYKGKVEEIIAFNELSGEGDIFISDILIIPGGEMPPAPKPVYAAPPQVPIGSSYFICPHSACKITQGLHWYNAIDFGGKCGDPIYAAAGGTVQRVGWNSTGGNYIMILHPNGVVTYYGHLSGILVSKDNKLSQGDIIGYMGRTGYATGCHVHFDVRGARNPFAR